MALMPAFLPKESSAFLTRDLAIHAANLFERPQDADKDQASLLNIFRLLEIYRFDAFVGYTPKGILEARSMSSPDNVDTVDGGVLKRALDSASGSVFPKVDKHVVVEQLENLVRTLASKEAPNEEQLRKARQFFRELAAALK